MERREGRGKAYVLYVGEGFDVRVKLEKLEMAKIGI